MSDLIKINYDSDRPTTSARDLWDFLGRPYSQFTKWFDQYKEYGFNENTDFRAISEKFLTAQGNESIRTDYEITVDMAKELAMLQKSEKGKMARLYFLELEKQWNSPEAVMARAIKLADKKIVSLEARIETDRPLVAFAETCAASLDSILVRELAKVACKQGINIGEHRLYRMLRAWKMIFAKSTEPYQEYVDRGYFEVVQSTRETAKGIRLFKTTRVTAKGKVYIIDRLRKEIA